MIAQQYAEVHKGLEGYLHTQAKDRQSPLVRPLWYDYPEDEAFYCVADEFLLGSDILAAPVLREGDTSREVILPSGEWRDAWTGETYKQGKLLDYPAPCPGMPIFVRKECTDLFEVMHRLLLRIDHGSVVSGVTSASYECGLDRDLSVTG
jgi:hypothetical protein